MNKNNNYGTLGQTVYTNDNYAIEIGDVPCPTDEWRYLAYLVINKNTRVVETAQNNLPHAIEAADSLNRMLTQPKEQESARGFAQSDMFN